MPLRRDLTAREVTDLPAGLHRVAPNLYLRVAPPTRRSWILIYRSPLTGRRAEMGLGPAALVPVAQAKATAMTHRLTIFQGRCPLAERKGVRTRAIPITFGRCLDLYIEAHKAAWRSREHHRQWSVSFGKHAPSLTTVPVSQVDTSVVIAALQPIWHGKTPTASRLRGRIESVLDFAKAHGWREGENPARWRGHLDQMLPGPKRLKPVRHFEAVAWRQLPDLWRQLVERGETAPALALRFTMLTACRRGEVLGATWEEIDLESRTWTIPAARMKGGKVHRVPLSHQTMQILRIVAALRRGKHVFPGTVTGRPIGGTAVLEMMRSLHEAATVHGLRSGFRDWCAEHGIANEVAEMALAHRVGDVTVQAYLRGDTLEPRRGAMQRWADFLDDAVDARSQKDDRPC
jgi:integrase